MPSNAKKAEYEMRKTSKPYNIRHMENERASVRIHNLIGRKHTHFIFHLALAQCRYGFVRESESEKERECGKIQSSAKTLDPEKLVVQ